MNQHREACLDSTLEVCELVTQGLLSPSMGSSSGLSLSPGGLSGLESLVAAPQAGHLPLQLLYPLPAPHPRAPPFQTAVQKTGRSLAMPCLVQKPECIWPDADVQYSG